MEVLIIFLFGLALGSFLNLLGGRLPRGEDVLFSRSHCDHCKKVLRWYELIPVISYLVQSGRCRRCHTPLSFTYPLVEIITGLGLTILYRQVGLISVPLLIFSWMIFAGLVVITVSDWKYEIIPDSMIVLLILSAFGYRFLTNTLTVQEVISATATALLFYLLWLATNGRGMGFGDVKLSLALGLLLGYPLIVVAVYCAFLTGAGSGVILILAGKKGLKSHISFGPFLIFGTLVALVWGERLLVIWQRLL